MRWTKMCNGTEEMIKVIVIPKKLINIVAV